MDEAQLEALRRLLALSDAYRLRELVVEEDGLRVTIRSGAPPTAAASHGEPLTAAEMHAAADEIASDEELEEEEAGFHRLRSPMTGIFYRSSSPDAPPFVVEGQVVEEGQTVGIIEAMKVFSEIPADIAGRVVRILAEAGTLLQEGDALMLVDVSES